PDHDEQPVRATRRTRRTQRKRKSSIEEEEDRAYSLRPRGNVDYRIPMPLEDLPMDPKDRLPPQRPRPKGRAAPSVAFGTLPFPPRGDDSDSDGFTRTPRRPLAGAGGGGNLFSAGAGGSMFPSDLAAAAGTPSNLGRVGAGTAAALADVDPLGVNQNVTFDEVGGLDEHIASLKEMTLLPLLYPELFQRFNVTPPRGVLFHGPPGTGKTLLARALAASCRSGGRQIAFFMRKGADCLSKWVGEAERQLRLLFEEARASQPAIIFFDEIDGLAPVRSAKQDQIHASIVSTLLALMDGMDGRGQVIVIGATNRPDAIDPALRRPGRFDREFYFPLPNITARERILRIHTKGWDGWEEGDAKVDATIKGLARITKGYGGADLRALCTEAALNAVQRRYPQIYGSSDRLVVKPETVRAEARDFMVSIKKMVPSSARSASSTASPLPTQLVPLLEAPLNNIKAVLDRIIPPPVKRSVLEEAQWEEEPAIQGGELDRELMLQNMESLRIHRPRLVIHGPPGMGQGYLGAAALHHLEAFNVQSLDLGALMSDASQSIEAAIVHLFVEAKRNQPSIVYIPSLLAFCAAVSDSALTTTRSMLDGLAPTDPVLLLAVVDGPWTDVPREVRSWFGFGKDGRIALAAPSAPQRERFFGELMEHVRRPPSAFPGAARRRKRALEVLPVAPPLAPRQPTEAELRVLEENDVRLIAQLKHRLNPVLLDLKRRFKRFTKAAEIEYGTDAVGNLIYSPPEHLAPPPPPPPPIEENPPSTPNGMVIDVDAADQPAQPNGLTNGHSEPEAAPAPPPEPAPQPQPEHPTMHLVDLERIHVALYNSKYLTPLEFLEDVHKIVQNADNMKHWDSERFFKAQALYTTAEVHMHEFEAPFVQECDRMAPRERKRRDDYKKMRAEAKKAAQAVQEAQQPQPPPGARRSARNNGQEPELGITDPVELERRLKRQRSTESAAHGSPREGEDEEGRASKRQKTSEPVDVFGAVATPTLSGTSEAAQPVIAMDVDLVAGTASNAMLAPEPLAVPTPPSNLANLLNPAPPLPPPPQADVPMEFAPQPEPPKDPTPPPPPPRTPSPSPGPPPVFNLSPSLADAFQAKLTSHTGGLSVEQLEQLRAACFDCVWRHRSDWDRDPALHEMDAIVDEFLTEVALDDQQDDIG
ncbi:AAA-domain-containing protein, partial [Auricularia subglabra TFB-10046 SS5]